MGQRIFVCGCGNVLLGDDGFGPAVMQDLQSRYVIPSHVSLVDAGTGVRELLLDFLLSAKNRPGMLVIVDSVRFTGKKPGEVFEIIPSTIPHDKIHDFSLHQFPTVNMLSELEEHTDMEVFIVAVQVEKAETEILPQLSPVVQDAVTSASQMVWQIIGNEQE